ncbi:MAG: polysaccharide deacetylase family protein [Anaerocolumna sp.]
MKKLILTFDDGPDRRYTGQLLDLLKQEQIKASFFVVAKNARKSPELIMRMKDEGHTVALHSLDHKHSPKELMSGLKGNNPYYLLAGFMMMLLFISCEALNIKMIMKELKQRAPFFRCLGYAWDM